MAMDMGALQGRNCLGCTRCCELLSVAELDKPPMVACTHCHVTGGCRIYRHRPTECRQFFCQRARRPGRRIDVKILSKTSETFLLDSFTLASLPFQTTLVVASVF